jgi:hypothetical protein
MASASLAPGLRARQEPRTPPSLADPRRACYQTDWGGNWGRIAIYHVLVLEVALGGCGGPTITDIKGSQLRGRLDLDVLRFSHGES